MAILQITVNTDQGMSAQALTLDGQDYIFRFYWNNRDESWYMDILLPGDVELIMGIKLVVNYELISRYIQENVPAGMIILFNEDNKQYSRYDINNSHLLVYVTADDELLS